MKVKVLGGCGEPRWDHKKASHCGAFLIEYTMNYYVYILQSTINGAFYIGQTHNLEKRFSEHNTGKSKYTSKGAPWNLLWYKIVESRKESYALEQD